jgi:MFS family permease
MGMCLPSMAAELGWETQGKGQVMSSLGLGFLLTQLLGGVMAAVFGARTTVAIGLAGSSLCCCLVPWMAAHSLRAVSVLFVLLGAIQGPMFPVAAMLTSNWVLPTERGWAAAQSDFAQSLAILVITQLVGSLLPAVGWRELYVAVGAGCLLYAGLFALRASSSPSTCTRIGDDERALLLRAAGSTSHAIAGVSGGASGGGTVRRASAPETTTISSSASGSASGSSGSGRLWWSGWLDASSSSCRLLLRAPVFALYASHLSNNFGAFTLIGWMPSYFADAQVPHPPLTLTPAQLTHP